MTPTENVLALFFNLRSIRTTTRELCSMAACFANGGKNPWSGSQIFEPESVTHLLSLMYSSGCGALSGEFSFKVGIPAKSSREGVVLLAIPRFAGVVVAAKELNQSHVSRGGFKFCVDFSDHFNCHALSGDSTVSRKLDPTMYHFNTDMRLCEDLLYAAEAGNIMSLHLLVNLGFSLSSADYDGRCAAHLAAARGHLRVIKFLYKHGADITAQDRWGCTPLEEARRGGHHKVEAALNRMVNRDARDCSDAGSVVSGISNASSASGKRSPTGKGSPTKRNRKGPVPVAAKMGISTVIAEDDEEED